MKFKVARFEPDLNVRQAVDDTQYLLDVVIRERR